MTFLCLLLAGNTEEAKQFFKTLYSFVYLQGTYLKPHVSIESLPRLLFEIEYFGLER